MEKPTFSYVLDLGRSCFLLKLAVYARRSFPVITLRGGSVMVPVSGMLSEWIAVRSDSFARRSAMSSLASSSE
jgi:hypothetical protein